MTILSIILSHLEMSLASLAKYKSNCRAAVLPNLPEINWGRTASMGQMISLEFKTVSKMRALLRNGLYRLKKRVL